MITGLTEPMHTLNESTAMSEPTPSPVPRVHVVKQLPGEGALAAQRPEPLRYAYTQTRVEPGIRARLLRMPLVVKGDNAELSETFRLLRAQVLPRMRADAHSVIAVTSPRRLHGKSLTALNLSLTLAADLDTSVLLLDAELGGQGVQRLLGLHDEPGLAEHLTQDTALSNLLVNPGVERLVVLPAGARAPGNSSELLATRLTCRMVQDMKQRYADRIVVVDLPPLLESADALAFLPWADTTLVVAEEVASRVRDLETAAELLAPFNLIGTVMSKAPVEKPARRRRWFEPDA